MHCWKLFPVCAGLLALFGGGVAHADHVPYALGDVFVASDEGKIGHFDSLGNLLEVLDTMIPAGVERGMCFDSSGGLYATNFLPQPGSVSQFNTQGALLTNAWAPPATFTGSPESCVFAANADAIVGEVDGENLLGGDLKLFDSSGTALATFMPSVEQRGVDWIDLAADQCTVYYTSEGTEIKRFDACLGNQLPDFGTVPLVDDAETETSHHCYALGIRENDEVVVACSTTVVFECSSGFVFRLNPDGTENARYEVEDCLFALALDPDATHVWTAGRDSGNVYKIDLNTGAGAAMPVFNSADAIPPPDTEPLSPVIGGLIVSSGPTAAAPDITLEPPTAENPTGTSHTVTATVTTGGDPFEGILVSFEVTAGPNTGEVSDPGECLPNLDCTTDATGLTSWTYASNGQTGVDTIRACVTDALGGSHCAEATKEWLAVNGPPDCTEAVAGILQVWPPNHKFVPVSVLGVSDPDGDATTTTILSIHQDEPTLQVGTGSGNTCPDGMGIGTSSASVRAERAGNPKVPGDGRVYHIGFTASDGTAACEGEVTLCVPHDRGKGRGCVDQGPLFDSTVCTRTAGHAAFPHASKSKSQ